MNAEDLKRFSADLKQKLEILKSSLPGLVGLDRGYRICDGRSTGEVVCRALVRSALPAGEGLSTALDLSRLLGEAIDLVPLSGGEALKEAAPPTPTAGAGLARRLNPLEPGVSVSRQGLGPGTLGIVAFRPTGEPVAVSCAHVLAGPFARRDDPVFQPGMLDGGNPDFDAIGYLADWFVDEDGDAAYAELNRSRMLGLEPLAKRGGVRRTALAGLGDRLLKTGRGSGATSARVDGIGLYRLSFSRAQEVWMSGFRLVPEPDGPQEISGPGDSGAVWYREGLEGGEGVGLHVDGEGSRAHGWPGYAIACHLPVVLDRFGLVLAPPRPVRDPRPAGWSESAWRVAEWVRRHPEETAELADVLAGMAREGKAASAAGGLYTP